MLQKVGSGATVPYYQTNAKQFCFYYLSTESFQGWTKSSDDMNKPSSQLFAGKHYQESRSRKDSLLFNSREDWLADCTSWTCSRGWWRPVDLGGNVNAAAAAAAGQASFLLSVLVYYISYYDTVEPSVRGGRGECLLTGWSDHRSGCESWSDNSPKQNLCDFTTR